MTPSTGPTRQQKPAFGERIMLRQYIHWRRLIGTTVQIRHNGRIIRTGTVDNAMADSTALWIAGDSTQSRAMYEAGRGIEVWSEPEETEDELCYRTSITTQPSH